MGEIVAVPGGAELQGRTGQAGGRKQWEKSPIRSRNYGRQVIKSEE
jgi:hypothetical protein